METSFTLSTNERFGPSLVATLVLLALVGVAAASCRDAMGPGFAVVVTVTQMQPPTYSSDAAGRQTLTCNATLKATATGDGLASWLDAVLTFYAVNKPTVPLNSDTVLASSIRDSWGGEYFGRDSLMQARWVVYAAIPFTATITFRYQVIGGREDSTSVSLPCKPAVPPGPPPTIPTLAGLPANLYEPGRTVGVSYTASSQVGLWDDVVRVSGPCDTVLFTSDSLRLTISRSVHWVLPATCALGVPLQVTVAAIDADLQTTERTITLPALVDTTPPTIQAIVPAPPLGTNDSILALRGDKFVGDSISILLAATDNHLLRSLHWEISPAGARDSIMVNGAGNVTWMAIPVLPGWAGPIQVSVYARDASGNTSRILRSVPDSVDVIPNVTAPTTLATVSLPFGGIVWDTRRGMLYLNQGTWKKIAFFSRAANAVTSTVVLNDYPVGFDLSAGGDSLVVALGTSRSLAIVNLQTSPPTATTVPLTGLDSTMTLVALVVAANGKALIAANDYAAGTGHIYTYDLATGTLRLRLDAGNAGQTGSGRMARSYDGSVVVLNGGPGEFQRYDAVTDAFEPATTARVTDVGPQLDRTGAHVAVAGDLYDAGLQYVLTPRAHQYQYQETAVSPDGQTIYFGYGNAGAVRSRISDGATIVRLTLPLTVNGMSISPDGSTMAVVEEALNGTDVLGLVDLTQLPASPPVAAARRVVGTAHE